MNAKPTPNTATDGAPIPNYNSTFYLIKRLIKKHFWPEMSRVYLAIVCMIFVAGSTAAFAWVMQPAMDEIAGKGAQVWEIPLINIEVKPSPWMIPALIVLIAVIKSMASFAHNFLMKRVGQRVVTDMQIRLYAHLLLSDMSFLTGHSSGSLISRFTNDIYTMRNSVSIILTGVMKELFTIIFLLSLMIYQNPVLSVVAFIAFPFGILPVVRLTRKMRQIARRTQEELGRFTSTLDETFQGIRLIKSYSREQHEISRARTAVERLFKLYVKAIRAESLTPPIMEILGAVGVASVFWYAGYQISVGETSVGSFASFITSLMLVYKPLKSVSSMNMGLQHGLAAARRLFMMYDVEATIKDSPSSKPLQLTQGSIQFNNVQFNYRPEKTALKNISLEIPQGSTVALVGPSGGGKSTIMNMILRFYDPNKGSVLIDDQDLRDVSLSSLRNQISFVSQDIMLFDDTVRNNILYGKLDATEDEIIQAAYSAAAHDFITALPEGYDTYVGEGGFKLSGGQRQRIAIARAMLKNAPILLLDEATSSLDTISEQQIQKALTELMKNRTTLVIAHRLSTIRNADLIYVIRNGEVVESGTHERLFALQGYYYTLCQHQFAGGMSADGNYLDLDDKRDDIT